jgi:hypothetical protein
MANRRYFLKTLGAATAAILAGQRSGVRAQTGNRKEVLVGGRPVPVVDIHAHCVFPDVAGVIAGTSLADRQFPAA